MNALQDVEILTCRTSTATAFVTTRPAATTEEIACPETRVTVSRAVRIVCQDRSARLRMMVI